ncbi:MAG: hypothetical protein JNM27_19210 [Leptospirales bacterium]|nr:hypothetical protein [Leptospirales bacterium]
MLREINASWSNNTASHQVSKSAFTRENMPPPVHLMSELDSNRQSDTDHRNSGADTTPQSALSNIKVNVLA